MNKPVIQSASDIINQPNIDDISAIKMVAVAIYPKAVKAIADYRENKNKPKEIIDKTPIVTGDEIREFMKRPLIENNRQESNVKQQNDGFER